MKYQSIACFTNTLLILGGFSAWEPALAQKSPVSKPRGEPTTLATMIERTRISVVNIKATFSVPPRSLDAPTLAFEMGAGFFVNRSGDIVTVAHVLHFSDYRHVECQRTSLRAELPIKQRSTRALTFIDSDATVVAEDRDLDLAVIRVDPKMFFTPPSKASPVVIDPSVPREGDMVFTLGFPYGFRTPYSSSGLVALSSELMIDADKPPTQPVQDSYWLDIQVTNGFSGSPAFSGESGAALGVIRGGPTASLATAQTIPSAVLIKFLSSHQISFTTAAALSDR